MSAETIEIDPDALAAAMMNGDRSRRLKVVAHAQDRMEERGITDDMVYDCYHNAESSRPDGRVRHYTRGDLRIVVDDETAKVLTVAWSTPLGEPPGSFEVLVDLLPADRVEALRLMHDVECSHAVASVGAATGGRVVAKRVAKALDRTGLVVIIGDAGGPQAVRLSDAGYAAVARLGMGQ